MRKLIAMMLAAVLVMTTLCGCNILEWGNPPELPKLGYDESSVTCLVEYVNGRTCKVSVLEGDGRYRAATEKREADVLYVTFASLSGSKSVQVGDTVRVNYSYATEVTERDGEPHITVQVLHVK